jgi:hypothetical protein
MMSMADVPLAWWNESSSRNAPKSTAPDLSNGVINATNDPVILRLVAGDIGFLHQVKQCLKHSLTPVAVND